MGCEHGGTWPNRFESSLLWCFGRLHPTFQIVRDQSAVKSLKTYFETDCISYFRSSAVASLAATSSSNVWFMPCYKVTLRNTTHLLTVFSTSPRARIHVLARQQQPEESFLRHHDPDQIPSIPHARPDIRHGRAHCNLPAGHGFTSRARLRLSDEDMADVWGWEELD